MSDPIEILRYFVGKYCTICTEQTGLKLTPEAAINYFAGIVEYLDDMGVVIRHPLTGCKSYFFMKHIVGMVEEQALDPRNPEHAEIIKQYKTVAEVKNTVPFEETSPWVNPKQIAEMARKVKDAHRKN